MFVLGAPEELEALVGLFGKLYVYTFDCATFYSESSRYEQNVHPNVHRPPLENRHQITVLIYHLPGEREVCSVPSKIMQKVMNI